MAKSALFGQSRQGVMAIEDQSLSTGNRFYVDSGSTTGGTTAGFGQSPDRPFTTLDSAIANCAANNGDIIYVMPGHAETLIADSHVDIDVAGISVIGLGRGADRPTFTFTTDAGADFKLAAASTHIENLLFVAGIDALTGPIEVTGADCSVVNCELRDATNFETVDWLLVAAGADRCLVDGIKYIHEGGTSGANSIMSVVNVAADLDGVEVRNCFIVCDCQLGCIEYAAGTTHVLVRDNYLESTHGNDVCITMGATSTGLIAGNRMKIVTNAQVSWITVDTDCALFDNLGVNFDAETGATVGTAST